MKSVIPIALMLTLTGCKPRYTPPEEPMPPNTVLLSSMMRELSAKPGFTEAMLHEIDGAQAKGSKGGPALLTPRLAEDLRNRILGKDWSGLDRFPGWTMREVNATVDVVAPLAGKNNALSGAAEVHPGSPLPSATEQAARRGIDLGPYALDRGHTASLAQPSTLPGFTTDGIVTTLGYGVVRGDGPNDLVPEHAASQRLADVLNRLAANDLDGARHFGATLGDVSSAQIASDPQGLIAALIAGGHTVTVTDSRYFANFGHFHFNGADVMMPFWVNTQIAVPGTGGWFHRPRPLLIPVSHAELEWHVRGPLVNADVSWYFGIDGKAEWRTMDTLDQAWVMKRNAHTYSNADAVEATRLTALMTVAYLHLHERNPKLPFGGYYTLGVCQDGVSAVEKKMTGAVTLFPNTADDRFFTDPQDAEVNAMFQAIPKDRTGTDPAPERIFGSLPTANFDAITIPGLAADLDATHAAWVDGKLRRTHGWWYRTAILTAAAVVVGLGFGLWPRRRRR